MNSKKSVEAILLGGALVVTIGGTMMPLDASAQVICSLSTNGIGSTVTGNTASFVKSSFSAKCSPNTVVSFTQSETAAAAKGGSQKGSYVFGATSEGGGGAVACGGTTVSAPHTAAGTAPANATDGCS